LHDARFRAFCDGWRAAFLLGKQRAGFAPNYFLSLWDIQISDGFFIQTQAIQFLAFGHGFVLPSTQTNSFIFLSALFLLARFFVTRKLSATALPLTAFKVRPYSDVPTQATTAIRGLLWLPGFDLFAVNVLRMVAGQRFFAGITAHRIFASAIAIAAAFHIIWLVHFQIGDGFFVDGQTIEFLAF
jgi:hypothetical protein